MPRAGWARMPLMTSRGTPRTRSPPCSWSSLAPAVLSRCPARWRAAGAAGPARSRRPPRRCRRRPRRTPPSPAPDPASARARRAGPAPKPGTGDVEIPPRRPRTASCPGSTSTSPKGDLDLRVNRLINKTFFEGQVKYNFINGDITAFLRYRYYGYKRTTQFTVFDAIEFDDIDEDVLRATSTACAEPCCCCSGRTATTSRTFGLVEIDRISTNKGERGSDFLVRRDRTNTFVRLGYQVGTPGRGRGRAPSRARPGPAPSGCSPPSASSGPATPRFTGRAHLRLRAGDRGLRLRQVRVRGPEAVRRQRAGTFLVGRLHGGTFPYSATRIRDDPPPTPTRSTSSPSPDPRSSGSTAARTSRGSANAGAAPRNFSPPGSIFFPGSSRRHHQFLRLDWQNWYWIFYTGLGTIGFDRDGLYGLRLLYPRRRHRFRVLFQPPEIQILSLRDCGTGFEREWGSRGANLGQVVPLSMRRRTPDREEAPLRVASLQSKKYAGVATHPACIGLQPEENDMKLKYLCWWRWWASRPPWRPRRSRPTPPA